MSFSSAPSNINLEKVEPLNQKRTLAFLNNWTMNTVSFLNQFSSVCESKLAAVDSRLQRTEDALSILEAKLSSIPGLEDVKATPSAVAPSQLSVEADSPAAEGSTTTAAAAKGAAGDGSTAAVAGATVAETEAKEAYSEQAATETSRPPISSDPRYSSYFKMVSVGVPAQAVKLKMASQGLDPALLDDPLAPAPDGLPSDLGDQASDSEEELSSWSDD